MTYSKDFRIKVLKVKEAEGLSFNEVSKRFAVSKTAVFRWSKNIESTGRRNKPWCKIDKVALLKDIKDNPDSYSYERAKRLGVSASGIRYAKKILKVNYKKKPQSSKSRSREKVYIL